SADGTACADPQNPVESTLLSGGAAGLIVLARNNTREDVDSDVPKNSVDDQFVASFQKKDGAEFAFDPLISLPPPGSCTVYSVASGVGGAGTLGFVPQLPAPGAALDAGPSLQVQSLAVNHAPMIPLWYAASLGSSSRTPPPSVLNPGNTVTITGRGGPDVGPFSVNT